MPDPRLTKIFRLATNFHDTFQAELKRNPQAQLQFERVMSGQQGQLKEFAESLNRADEDLLEITDKDERVAYEIVGLIDFMAGVATKAFSVSQVKAIIPAEARTEETSQDFALYGSRNLARLFSPR